jgi:2-hydroxy-6-oxonona-2,4-dienedioate hydrolase
MGRVSRDMAIPDRWTVQAANLKTLMLADERNIDGLAVYLQDRNTARTRLRSRPMSLKEPLGPLLGQIRCPISAVWGRQDAVYPDDTRERESLFQNLTPAVTPTFINPGGHWIQFEQADIFNRYLLELLSHRLERPPY